MYTESVLGISGYPNSHGVCQGGAPSGLDESYEDYLRINTPHTSPSRMTREVGFTVEKSF